MLEWIHRIFVILKKTIWLDFVDLMVWNGLDVGHQPRFISKSTKPGFHTFSTKGLASLQEPLKSFGFVAVRCCTLLEPGKPSETNEYHIWRASERTRKEKGMKSERGRALVLFSSFRAPSLNLPWVAGGVPEDQKEAESWRTKLEQKPAGRALLRRPSSMRWENFNQRHPSHRVCVSFFGLLLSCSHS